MVLAKNKPSQHACDSTAESLRLLLANGGALPDERRPTAWRVLLGLPCNAEAHQSLNSRGEHKALTRLRETFPLRGKADVRLRITLSALAHWSPTLADLPYLPALVFPITQVFGADHMLTFEFIATFFMNWGVDWLDFFPSPPVGALSRAVDMLESADPELASHLVNCLSDASGKAGSLALAVFWPLLQTLLSEVLSRRDWFALWDHLVARWRESDLLVACAVALIMQRRLPLLALQKGDPLALDAALRRSRKCPSVLKLLKVAEGLLHKSLGSKDMLKKRSEALKLPMPSGLSYAVLDRPRAVVGYTAAEIARMEEEFSEIDISASDRRLRTFTSKLAESSEQIHKQQADILRETNGKYLDAVKDESRLAKNRLHKQIEINSGQIQIAERLNNGAEEVLQRQLASHNDDILKLTDELEVRRQRRSVLAEQLQETQRLMDLEEQAAQELTERLRKQRLTVESSHASLLADLGSRDCKALGDLRKQQLRTHDDCLEVRLQANLAAKGELVNAKASAHAKRRAEAELAIEGLSKELELGRNVSERTLEHVLSMSKSFEEDVLRLQQQRQSLAQAFDAHALADEAATWERLENEEAWRQLSATVRKQSSERVRRCSEREAVLFSELQKDAESRLRKAAAIDVEAVAAAAAAQDAGHEFRPEVEEEERQLPTWE